jgi:hypothetical protein
MFSSILFPLLIAIFVEGFCLAVFLTENPQLPEVVVIMTPVILLTLLFGVLYRRALNKERDQLPETFRSRKRIAFGVSLIIGCVMVAWLNTLLVPQVFGEGNPERIESYRSSILSIRARIADLEATARRDPSRFSEVELSRQKDYVIRSERNLAWAEKARTCAWLAAIVTLLFVSCGALAAWRSFGWKAPAKPSEPEQIAGGQAP